MVQYIDEVQSHILAVITGLMTSYGLTIDQIKGRMDFLNSLSPEQISNYYVSPIQEDIDAANATQGNLEEEAADPKPEHEVLFVSTRREFCLAMGKGIKICPQYSTCQDGECENFHIKEEFLCNHVTRGSYCEAEGCEKIIIRPCRKGRRCRDNGCSFRH